MLISEHFGLKLPIWYLNLIIWLFVILIALQSIPPTIWYRLVAGLNAQLRLVCHGHLRKTLGHVVQWLETHANPTLSSYGIRLDLACFQPTASGYCQFGLLVCSSDSDSEERSVENGDGPFMPEHLSW